MATQGRQRGEGGGRLNIQGDPDAAADTLLGLGRPTTRTARPAMKKMEDTDIIQRFLPRLEAAAIPLANIRYDAATAKTGRGRGDVWVGEMVHDHPDFERRILALIECKAASAALDDRDWQDAKAQGQKKAKLQRLPAFFVTNTADLTRCYATSDLKEVSVDGATLTRVPPPPMLLSIRTQLRRGGHQALYRSLSVTSPDPKAFRSALSELREVYRACGMSKGSENGMVQTTLTFCILKIVSEQQARRSTLPRTVQLWDEWREGHVAYDARSAVSLLVEQPSHKHLAGCLAIDAKIDDEAAKKVYDMLSRFEMFGSDFDFFGLIYETLAEKKAKKDFGEFYTPRHLIRSLVRLIFRDETAPRPLSIGDPACGTGGFLVESFLYLQRTWGGDGGLPDDEMERLRKNVFHGLDNNEKVAIPFARTNMTMADDGGANIVPTPDSLVSMPEAAYDVVLSNPPYGKYAGRADVASFTFARKKRFEVLFLEKIVDSLKDGGRAVVIVPDGLVENVSYKSARVKFLQAVTLEAVLSLHPSVFEPYTGEKTYVLIFTKRPAKARGGRSGRAGLALHRGRRRLPEG